ncbi:MAG TPA: Rpn family recombination-promoting nuclease/putative transposase [Gemmataceae bacterium]|nr:Rpn family recombination-promoting nuclease/putative transposase [Gemmataceae bacterium]
MIPGIDPKVDYAFKHVFGREQNQSLLIHLLHAVLQPPPQQQIIVLEILNPFNDKDALDDKLSILDIKARDQSGRHFNVEMQLLAYGAFRQRALYYWARLHQAQLQEGMDYQTLRPTIAICFVDSPLFPEIPAYHLLFELRERQQGLLFTDQLAVHILELPKFTKSVAELATPLDRWLYFLRHGETLDTDHLPGALDVPEIHRALGDLQMMTQSELERERYESRLKMQRDIYTALKEARDEGRQEERRQGRIERIQFLQRLLRQALTPVEHLQTQPAEELERLVDELEAEALARMRNGS